MRLMKYSAVEALLRAFEVEDGSELMTEIRNIFGIEQRHRMNEVAAEDFVKVVNFLARRFYPELPLNEAYFKTGKRVFSGYRETILGRVQFAAVQMMPVDRVVKFAPENMNRNTNFGSRRWEQISSNKYRFIFEDDPPPPAFCAGMFQAGLEATKAKNPRVTYRQTGVDKAEYILEWE